VARLEGGKIPRGVRVMKRKRGVAQRGVALKKEWMEKSTRGHREEEGEGGERGFLSTVLVHCGR